ncbi:MAG TPA: DNA-binding protein [Polyangiaceae bacterium]|nr:DNA-binding protein [Polyangiaceae bacterium]
MPTYRTLAGEELEYPEPSKQLARFIGRLNEAVNDPDVGADEMTDLVYGPDNPLLGPSTSALPERRSVSLETLADPTWHMMLDLLEAKRIAIAEASPTMRLEHAGELLGITPDAVRKAAIAGHLDGEKHGNRWYVSPGSVATYRERVRRRGPRPNATPLLIRCGSVKGASLSVKSANPAAKKRVRKQIAAAGSAGYCFWLE